LEISNLCNHRADDCRAAIAQTQQIVEVAFNLPCMRMSKSLPGDWPTAAWRLFGLRTGDKIQNVSILSRFARRLGLYQACGRSWSSMLRRQAAFGRLRRP